MNRRTLALGAIGVVMLTLAWFFLLWSPKGDQLDDARALRDAAQEETTTAKLRLARLESDASRKAELAAEQSRLLLALPQESHLAPLLLEINSVAQQTGVEFLSIAPSEPVIDPSGGPAAIGLNIQLQGSYFPAIDFLQRLMAFNRLVVVDGLSLSPGANGTDLSAITMALTARAFTTELPAGAAAPAAQPG